MSTACISVRKVIARKEAEIYAALGLQFIEPELREGIGEIELPRKKRLPHLERMPTSAEFYMPIRIDLTVSTHLR